MQYLQNSPFRGRMRTFSTKNNYQESGYSKPRVSQIFILSQTLSFFVTIETAIITEKDPEGQSGRPGSVR